LLREERKRKISEFIEENKKATVAELSELFGVSESTIRRDLEELDEQGVIQRAHGGAVVVERAAPEPPIIQRIAENEEKKRRIGEAAAELVRNGETVFLGSGTTTLEVARNLVKRDNLTVITNALNIANLFAGKPNITVIVVGGLLRHSELSLIGHITEQVLKELHADKVIMGMRAVSIEEGLTSDYLSETMTDRTIIQFAPEVILVADHTKFGKVSTAYVAPVEQITTLVTDAETDPALLSRLREMGIQVIVAE
jgi:DeoR/GlpR family transcriptional regulator of sugar metabolism